MRHDGVLEPLVKCFEVRKINKRLHVVDVQTGESFYTPPDFLRPHIRNRDEITALAERLTTEWPHPIRAIMAFEAAIRPEKRQKSPP